MVDVAEELGLGTETARRQRVQTAAGRHGQTVHSAETANGDEHINDSAAGFMTENKGWLDDIVADSPVLIIVDVGATDAHVFKFDEDFKHQLEHSSYPFQLQLFPAVMQGEAAEKSILAATFCR